MNTPARSNHKSPRGWKSYAFGAAAAASLLAATACGHGSARASDASEPAAPPSATASPKPSGAPSEAGGESTTGTTGGTTGGATAKSGGTKGGTGSGSGSASGSGGKAATTGGGTATGGGSGIPACTQKELGVSAVKERDLRHLVLTVQNASDKKCNVYGYPVVTLGADAQFTTPVIKDSNGTPGEPVTLDPGREAYAALLVSSGNTGEHQVKSISIRLQGSKPGSSVGTPIDVPLPASSLNADNGQLVTYWTTASGYALDFIMSK
ncbi:DUF4232 domain-containing protein [Streptomyces sp. NPDC059618]|uniref:DUF4232 domain-containing protein n=1 Tax=Streptomyces sp. NPDC059618 TaxID=3346887 RepID=UPI00367B9424